MSGHFCRGARQMKACVQPTQADRKSTRLNSSHLGISYAVFCLKKKKGQEEQLPQAGKRYIGGLAWNSPFDAVLVAGRAGQGVQFLEDDIACFAFFVFFLMIGRPPSSPLFPYPALFR